MVIITPKFIWQPNDTTTHQDHVIAHVIGATVLGYFVFEEALYILLEEQIKADIDLLLGNDASPEKLLRLIRAPVESQIKDVSFFTAEDRRRLIVAGEEANLAIETSLATGEVLVMTLEDEERRDENAKLEDIAQSEHKYLHQRLREDLGREPTEEELDEWLRQHTEGY